ncbi:hypothetical protein ACFQV4_19920 [Streptomyces thermocarboxydus]
MTSQTVTGVTLPMDDARRARYVARVLDVHDHMSLAAWPSRPTRCTWPAARTA